MASWIVHLRIADKILDNIIIRNIPQFVVGNIAPDCGDKVEGGYYPPSTITHFSSDNNKKNDCDYKRFYREYIKNEKNPKKISFYWGYYIHLFTDVLWVNNILVGRYYKKYRHVDKKEYMLGVRDEAFELEKIFLKDKSSFSYSELCKIKSFDNIYLDYYKKKQIENKIIYIADFYKKDLIINKFRYIDQETLTEFIEESSKIIFDDIKKIFTMREL